VYEVDEVEKCPKCRAALTVKEGKKGSMRAVAKSLLTMRIETTYVCSSCGYSVKRQTTIQK
jgi:DNA-directed RNA polymerase subunit M/transcription elongation factor TFIIS